MEHRDLRGRSGEGRAIASDSSPANAQAAGILALTWDLQLHGETWSTPAIVRAGDRRIVVAADRAGWIQAFDGGTGTLVWERRLSDAISSSPLPVDFRGDGQADLVVGDHAGDLFRLRASDGAVVWKVALGEMIRAVPAAADIDGDGEPELVVAGYGPVVLALKASGEILWRRQLPKHLFIGKTKRGAVSSPLVWDVDRDGQLEIVLGIRSARAYCLDARTGEIKWFTPLGYDSDSAPSFVLGAADEPLVLIGGGEHTGGEGDNAVIALDGRNGAIVWAADVGGGVDCAPMVLSREGASPLVFACSLCRPAVTAIDAWSKARVWRHDFGPSGQCYHDETGRCRPSVERNYFTEDAICRSYTNPFIIDIDSDGVSEVLAGSNNGELVVLDAETGNLRERVMTGGMVRGSFVIDDLDGDGLGELVVPCGERLLVYRTPCRGQAVTMFKARADHLGCTTAPPPPVGAVPRPVPRHLSLSILWRLHLADIVRHMAIKLDEKILRHVGVRLLPYGY